MATIEENAKAYTELINRLEDVKDAIKKQNYGIAMDILYKPYPEFQITTSIELKENEDEKIRKQITGFITYSRVLDETKKNWLAWLEKQGEQKLIDKIQLGKKYKCIASPRYSTFMKGLIYKPEDEFLCSLMNFCSNCFEPMEDNDQKPADKVEPKFKKGDWVVTSYGKVNQVVFVDEDLRGDVYTLDDGTCFSGSWCDMYHLWTIQDAKDGDVLADSCAGYKNPLISILKKFEHKDIGLAEPSDYSSYCFLTMSNKQDFKEGSYHHMHNIHPATKEQRDLLFQKIHEAGYEWDSEKKELKKEEEVYNLHNYLYDKQSPVWSKEDKDYYDAIITKLEVTQEDATLTDNQMNFLKSLKERYTWKPSDEQMDAIKDAIDYLGENTKIVRKHLMSLHEQLKKLREE